LTNPNQIIVIPIEEEEEEEENFSDSDDISKPTEEPGLPVQEETSTPSASKDLEESRATDFPFEAQIKSRTARILSQPTAEARVLVLLKQADRLQLLGQQDDFFEVEYWLESQFPIRGFVLKEHFGDLEVQEIISPKSEQAFTPTVRNTPIQTKALNLESQKSQEPVSIPKSDQDFFDLQPSVKTPLPLARPRAPDEWHFPAQIDLGWQKYDEKVSTRVEGSYPKDPLISYQLEGLNIDLSFGGFRQWFNFLEAGARLQYSVSLLHTNVKASNTHVEASDVLAQWHRLGAEIFASPKFYLKRWAIEPEVGFGVQWQIFSVNQLRDKALAQPVLFSEIRYFPEIFFKPRIHSPFYVNTELYLGLLPTYRFSEGPLQSTSNGVIRTGKPKTQSMLLHYGGSLIFDLQGLGLQRQKLMFTYKRLDFSKSFSGEGHRAGFQLEAARSKTSVHHLSLGYAYEF